MTEAREGYVVRRTVRGETDVVVDVLLDDGALVRAVARAGARSTRRYAGGLSPFVAYRLRFGRPRGVWAQLDEAVVARHHAGVLSRLVRTSAAGAASILVREVASAVGGEPHLFEAYDDLIRTLDGADDDRARATLACFTLHILAVAGHEPNLGACVRCARPVPEGSKVTVRFDAGGVVCRACGGGAVIVTWDELQAVRRAMDMEDVTPSCAIVVGFVRPHAPMAAEALAKVLG